METLARIFICLGASISILTVLAAYLYVRSGARADREDASIYGAQEGNDGRNV